MNEQRYTHGDLLAEVDEALREQPKTFRQEVRDMIRAPKGSDTAKARSVIGWTLVLFGLVGVPLLFLAVVLVGAIVGAIGDALGVLLG